MDCVRFPISEMHLGKLPESMEFQSWTVNIKTEICAKTTIVHSQCIERDAHMH